MATQSLPKRASFRYAHLLALALLLGGAFWVMDFVFIINNGKVTGSLPTAAYLDLPFYLRLGMRLFVTSILVINLGLLSLWWRTWPKAKGLNSTAGLFMLIAVGLASINTVSLSGLIGVPAFNDTFMGLSIFATSIATGILSFSALRTNVLPRHVAFLLLFVGITTIPILFSTPLPVGPDWATDHLAFLTSGIAYVLAGIQLGLMK